MNTHTIVVVIDTQAYYYIDGKKIDIANNIELVTHKENEKNKENVKKYFF